MYSFRKWKAKYGKVTIASLWDLFMVWVVFINLCLILFDLTYLWLRPTYFRYVPVVTRIWDPVLGIEPQPLTEDLIETADRTEQLFQLDPASPNLGAAIEDLRALTLRVFVENPFERSGQTEQLDAIKEGMARETGFATSHLGNPEILAEIVQTYWSGPPELLRHRFELFNLKFEPMLAVNYFRGYDLDGRLINHFWKIDLPFLILFWIEFMARWVLAARRRTYARWYFFPIFYWYDLLSLIPVMALRPLRLLRIVSIYMRLRQSELSRVGRDFLSRAVAYISNIITEEVSDRVAVSTTLETIVTTIDSPEGQEAVQAVAASVIDELFDGPALAEIEAVAKEISLQVIDQMKDVVMVKKWSLPDEQGKRPPMPWEGNSEP